MRWAFSPQHTCKQINFVRSAFKIEKKFDNAPGNEFLKANQIFHRSINDCDRGSAPQFFFFFLLLKTPFQNHYIRISSELMQSEETV